MPMAATLAFDNTGMPYQASNILVNGTFDIDLCSLLHIRDTHLLTLRFVSRSAVFPNIPTVRLTLLLEGLLL